jgi:hypothetical protein
MEEEVGSDFQSMALSEMDTPKLFQWIESYFG